ncbi:MAG: RHS repeat-associated core domain-containing protein [Marinifilaceae bacterium]
MKTADYANGSGLVDVDKYDVSGISYDANGNMTRDLNKGIKDIKYNELNLPESISFADGRKISYIYSAAGEKLQNIVGGKTISYCCGFVYEDGKLSYILNSEGRYVVGTDSSVYEYNICDHLGNVRAVVDSVGTVKQQSDYYPFGGVFAQAGSPDNKYLYNGKEKQEGTDWFDYGARMYSADLGRFMTVDPLSESYYGLSPYGYCAGSPIACRDENGEWINFVVGALIGVATDYVGQVASNAFKDGGFRIENLYENLDYGDLAVSAIEGALTSGGSAIKKTSLKVAVIIGSEITRNAIDFKLDGFKVNSVGEVVKNTAIGLSLGKVGEVLPTPKVKMFKASSTKGAVKKARIKAKKKGTTLSRKDRVRVEKKAKKRKLDIKNINQTVSGTPQNMVFSVASEILKVKIN